MEDWLKLKDATGLKAGVVAKGLKKNKARKGARVTLIFSSHREKPWSKTLFR